MLEARFAEMDLGIDDARQDGEALGIDLLRGHTRRVLLMLCHTEVGADFWLRSADVLALAICRLSLLWVLCVMAAWASCA